VLPPVAKAVLWLVLAAACLHGFHGVSQYYRGFDIFQGAGSEHVHHAEVVFFAWYLLLGGLAAWFLTCLLVQTRHPERLLGLARRLLAAPPRVAFACALLVLASSLAFRRLVLLGQVIADDELTYDFVAATLLEGRVLNRSPIAAEFLANPFVIATEQAWYGKYPIGHPLLLALGKAVHAQALVVPLLGAVGVLLTYAVGRRLIGERLAALACVLLALSPHFVWTHATQLSQPASTVCMLLAMLGLLRLAESGRLAWAALAGAALGYGVLARPAPGVLFVIAAFVAYAVQVRLFSSHEQRGRRAAELALIGAGVAAGVLGVLLVNHAQSGDPWTSGYHTLHGGTGALATRPGLIASSVGAALLRENFWLYGWPLSLAFVPFARFARGGWLGWGMIAAALAYRVLVPKTVVATTGPVYTLEVVPLLCIATVSGMARVVALLTRAQFERERAQRAIAAAVLAATMVALVLFVPVQLRSIQRAALARSLTDELLREARVERALVFADLLVPPDSGLSWAFAPPNPAPALDENLIFVRALPGDDGYQRMLQLWRTRFADRRAVWLILTPQGLVLRELPVQPDAMPPEIVWRRKRRS
jgi:hypothetical protein